jgi:hypothetical protein
MKLSTSDSNSGGVYVKLSGMPWRKIMDLVSGNVRRQAASSPYKSDSRRAVAAMERERNMIGGAVVAGSDSCRL